MDKGAAERNIDLETDLYIHYTWYQPETGLAAGQWGKERVVQPTMVRQPASNKRGQHTAQINKQQHMT